MHIIIAILILDSKYKLNLLNFISISLQYNLGIYKVNIGISDFLFCQDMSNKNQQKF